MVWVLVVALVLLSVAAIGWVRGAPSDPARWHVDPATGQSGPGSFVVRPKDGDSAGPTIAMPPVEALAAFDAVALAEPQTERLAGSVQEGRITYVARSKSIGFPDYITVEARPAEGGSQFVIYARLRFGRSDLGVNQARIERWFAALGAN